MLFGLDASTSEEIENAIKRTNVTLSEKDQKLFKLLDQGQNIVLGSQTILKAIPANQSQFRRVDKPIEQVEDQAISFKVVSPISKDGHYYYEIQTKFYPKGVLHQISVHRRYNDFKLLQEYLFMYHGVDVFVFPLPEGEGAISKLLSSSLETLEKRRAQFELSLTWLKEYQNIILKDEVFIDFYKSNESFQEILARRLQALKKEFPNNYHFLTSNYSRLFTYPVDFALESHIEESRKKLAQINQTQEILNEYTVALDNRFPKSIPKNSNSPQIYDELQRLLNNAKKHTNKKTEITLRINSLLLELQMMNQMFSFIQDKRDYLVRISNTNEAISNQRAQFEKILIEQARMFYLKADLIFSNILGEMREIFDN